MRPILAILIAAATLRCTTPVCIVSGERSPVFREFYGISLPTREDNELARRLPPEVLLAVQRYYCPGGVWAGTRITCSPENIHINSARVAGKYILLHANHGAIDGSRGLVYSPSRRCVVGMFVWFIEA